MRARACVATGLQATPSGRQRSYVSTLRSQAPLLLRLARPKEPVPIAVPADAVRVCLAAGAGGPVGGDELTLHIEVGAGSCLVLSEVSPTLLLPGPHGEPSRTRTRIRVASDGTLIWLPEPVIAAHRSLHRNDIRVDLDTGARFFMREEMLLGRHGEPTGTLRQSLRVRLAGQPLYRQDLCLGAPGTNTPAVLGPHRAVGSLLIAEPAWAEHPPPPRAMTDSSALLPLSGPAAVVTAVADDNLELRTRLEAGLTLLDPPWGRCP